MGAIENAAGRGSFPIADGVGDFDGGIAVSLSSAFTNDFSPIPVLLGYQIGSILYGEKEDIVACFTLPLCDQQIAEVQQQGVRCSRKVHQMVPVDFPQGEKPA
ncbi:MAG: hypothetical protein FJ244_03785 [Nitrospira sp.]|nr:hypothetical protein [Nitrospira sp.]